jgi:hypothetical protein
MKRRITLSIAVVLSIALVSLTSSDSTANAAPPRTYFADTGMIPLGPDRVLRVAVIPVPSGSLNDGRYQLTVLASQVTTSNCSGGLCAYTVTSQTTSDPLELRRGQAVSYDLAQTAGASAVRAIVRSNRPDIHVNALIIDPTGAVVEFLGGVQVAAGDVD